MTAMTHPLAIVGIYAALNTIILMTLTFATGSVRRKYKIAVGDGGEPNLIRIMRGHANAAENIPMMMILLILAAAIGTPAGVLHAAGIVFTVSRALHAWHFMQDKAPMWTRFAGFGGGMITMLLLALGLLGHALVLVLR